MAAGDQGSGRPFWRCLIKDRKTATLPAPDQPPVLPLLDADALHCATSAVGDLKRIAPIHFNPTGEPWLPIMHSDAVTGI